MCPVPYRIIRFITRDSIVYVTLRDGWTSVVSHVSNDGSNPQLARISRHIVPSHRGSAFAPKSTPPRFVPPASPVCGLRSSGMNLISRYEFGSDIRDGCPEDGEKSAYPRQIHAPRPFQSELERLLSVRRSCRVLFAPMRSRRERPVGVETALSARSGNSSAVGSVACSVSMDAGEFVGQLLRDVLELSPRFECRAFGGS